MTPSDLRDDQVAGERVRQIVESPEYQQAWKTLHERAMNALLQCAADDDQARYRHWVEVKTLMALNGVFQSVMRKGESAKAALEHFDIQQERLKSARHTL